MEHKSFKRISAETKIIHKSPTALGLTLLTKFQSGFGDLSSQTLCYT